MGMKKKIAVTTVIFFFLILIISSFIYDKTTNVSVRKIEYRVYTKEKGWSKWSKNGAVSGNKKDDIIKVEVKTNADKGLKIKYYDGIKWIESNKKAKKGIVFSNMYAFTKNYSMCYRTYNEHNTWLNWTCSNSYDNVSGNSKYSIKAIEIKIVPRGVVLNDYLKNYKINRNDANYNFD